MEFVEELRKYQVFRKEPAPWSWCRLCLSDFSFIKYSICDALSYFSQWRPYIVCDSEMYCAGQTFHD
jgi:hypothetical protein